MIPSESSTSSRWTRFVLMYVLRALICGRPPSAPYCETRPGRVRTPPGKKSTSARLGDIPGGTSEGSSSVIQVLNTFSGNGEKVSIDMISRRKIIGKVGLREFLACKRRDHSIRGAAGL